jgi:hypothetical protein
MTLRAVLAAAALGATIVGFCLPVSHGQADPKSQIEQIDVGRF